jgi:hypothetical protein
MLDKKDVSVTLVQKLSISYASRPASMDVDTMVVSCVPGSQSEPPFTGVTLYVHV